MIKKNFTIFVVTITIVFFSGCSNNTGISKLLSKEGIKPYELSESDTYLLQTLEIQDDVNIISFKAPKDAKSLKLNVYVLNSNNNWDVIGGGQVYAEPDSRLEGTFAMILKDNHAINFNINTMGRASYQTDSLKMENEISASSKSFLRDFQRIEINKEIPIAIMIYDSGTMMRAYSLENFFSPSRFKEMDLVQAVTLTFTD
ncbi:hypothetical protein [Senegalia massiliensis]|uniref:hypothetical protein n=1 Tax=Senegalia massiliensis TaxID=1720316 RepID=UPI00103019FC|nr:hypothetical protein [Senegalia massiliensis]